MPPKRKTTRRTTTRKKKTTKKRGLAGLRISLNPSATPTAGLGGSGKANV